MITEAHLAAFIDELEKISAQKCRKKSTPIRVHNLAAKSKYDGRGKMKTKLSFWGGAKKVVEEPLKSEASRGWLRSRLFPAAMGWAGRHPVIATATGITTPIVAWEQGKDMRDTYRIGKAMRERMEAAQGR